MLTSPITEALGATKAAASDTSGATPSTATNRVDGTSFSVYLATSSCAPKPSRADLSKKRYRRMRQVEFRCLEHSTAKYFCFQFQSVL